MEGNSNPITRIAAILFLCIIGALLTFGGMGAWMLGAERIWTLAQWITGAIVVLIIGAAIALVTFSTSFPIRARTRGPDQAMTQIIENRHHYDGLTKERIIQYGQDPDARQPNMAISGPHSFPAGLVTGGGTFDLLPPPPQHTALRLDQAGANKPDPNRPNAIENEDYWS